MINRETRSIVDSVPVNWNGIEADHTKNLLHPVYKLFELLKHSFYIEFVGDSDLVLTAIIWKQGGSKSYFCALDKRRYLLEDLLFRKGIELSTTPTGLIQKIYQELI